MSRPIGLASRACRASALLMCLLGTVPVLGQSERYVTDRLRLEARSGPSTEYKIVEMLASGTRVDVLEQRSGYSLVRMATGREVWILSRFLQEALPAREQVEATLRDIARHRQETEDLRVAVSEIERARERVSAQAQQGQNDNRALRQELAEIKQAAASTLAIIRKNKRLRLEVVQLTERLELLETERRKLKETDEQEWFVAGGGVLVAGLILGFILPKLGARRRRGWSAL